MYIPVARKYSSHSLQAQRASGFLSVTGMIRSCKTAAPLVREKEHPCIAQTTTGRIRDPMGTDEQNLNDHIASETYT